MSVSDLKNMALVLGCIAGLVLAQRAAAQGGTVLPQVIVVEPIQIGDDPPPDSIIYNNTTITGYYYSPPTGAVPCEVADDVPFTGTYHVDSFTFGYATNQTGDQEVIVKFYGALMQDAGPAGSPVQSVDITGLPGSSDGTVESFIVTVDLVALGKDFSWTNSSIIGYNFNWVSFTFQQQGAGLLAASGGGSVDVFWTGTDLNSPFGTGSFYWDFNGTPTASFYLQISGYAP